MAAQSMSTISTRITQPEFNSISRTRNSLGPIFSQRSQWLGTMDINISRKSVNLCPFLQKHPSISATISFSLPTAKPDRVSSTEKIPKWSSKAIKSFAMGELEARKFKSTNTGTEALLMGLLIEGTNIASKFLRSNGITLLKVRDEIPKLREKSDFYYFSPEHPPLTEATQKALDWAIDEKLKTGEDGEVTTAHLLLGLWHQEEALGHQVLIALGFTHEKAKEIHAIISKPGSIED